MDKPSRQELSDYIWGKLGGCAEAAGSEIEAEIMERKRMLPNVFLADNGTIVVQFDGHKEAFTLNEAKNLSDRLHNMVARRRIAILEKGLNGTND